MVFPIDEGKVIAKIAAIFLEDSIGLGFAAAVVGGFVEVSAIQTGMQVRSAVRTRIPASYLRRVRQILLRLALKAVIRQRVFP